MPDGTCDTDDHCLPGMTCVQGRCAVEGDLACPADDEFEENDSRQEATLVHPDQEVHGIVCSWDHDWFEFEIETHCSYSVLLAYVSAVSDLDMRLYDVRGILVAESHSQGDFELLELDATEDTSIYVDVYGYEDNQYSLTITADCPEGCQRDRDCDEGLVCLDGTCLPAECDVDGDCLFGNVCDHGHCVPGEGPSCPADDEFEENDSRPDATEAALHTTYDALVCGYDHDWFGFEAHRGCSYTITATFTHAVGNLDVKVYRQDGIRIGASMSTTDDEEVHVEADQDATIYVEVYSADGESNTYSLTIEEDACPGGG